MEGKGSGELGCNYKKELDIFMLNAQEIRHIADEVADRAACSSQCTAPRNAQKGAQGNPAHNVGLGFLKAAVAVVMMIIIAAAIKNAMGTAPDFSGLIVYAQDGTAVKIMQDTPIVLDLPNHFEMGSFGGGQDFLYWEITLVYAAGAEEDIESISYSAFNVEFMKKVELEKARAKDYQWLSDNNFFAVYTEGFTDPAEESVTYGLQSLGNEITKTDSFGGASTLGLKLNAGRSSEDEILIIATAVMRDGSDVEQAVGLRLICDEDDSYSFVLQAK